MATPITATTAENTLSGQQHGLTIIGGGDRKVGWKPDIWERKSRKLTWRKLTRNSQEVFLRRRVARTLDECEGYVSCRSFLSRAHHFCTHSLLMFESIADRITPHPPVSPFLSLAIRCRRSHSIRTSMLLQAAKLLMLTSTHTKSCRLRRPSLWRP